jgi:DNA-directed RNA polymerase specialized sigma24 family protein
MTIIADPPPHPDQALVAAAAADSAAFVYLYTKYVDKIYQFIYYRTGQNPEVAQDLTAEVFARGLQHIDRFEWQGYPYSAYLYQIARGLCQRSYNQPVLVEIDDGVPSPVSGQVIAVQAGYTNVDTNHVQSDTDRLSTDTLAIQIYQYAAIHAQTPPPSNPVLLPDFVQYDNR